MKICEIKKLLNLKAVCETENKLNAEIDCAVCGDMLSHIMSHSKGGVWVTVTGNINTVAVAVFANIKMIIIANGCEIDEDAAEKAEEIGIAVYQSEMSEYEICGRLYEKLKK